MSTLIPGGAIGVLLKSYGPLNCAQADSFGFILDPRSRFSVNSACGKSLSHIGSGKLEGVVQKLEMRWFVAVWIARSAAFAWWLWGGTSCLVTPWDFRKSLISWEHSLSRNCRLTQSPASWMRL